MATPGSREITLFVPPDGSFFVWSVGLHTGVVGIGVDFATPHDALTNEATELITAYTKTTLIRPSASAFRMHESIILGLLLRAGISVRLIATAPPPPKAPESPQ
jgi:hypothetical protein